MAKAFAALFVVFLTLPLLSSAAVCSLTTLVATVCVTPSNCPLATLLSTAACPVGDIVELALSTGDYTFEFGTTTTISNALSFTASGSASIMLNFDASGTTTIANNVYLYGNTVLNVATGTTVQVQGDVNVAAASAVQIVGTLSVSANVYVNGTVGFAGTLVKSSAQTAWLIADSIRIHGESETRTAFILGNGGLNGNVYISGCVLVNCDTDSNTFDAENYVYFDDNIYVEANATFKVAGNVTTDVGVTVYGTLQLAGTTTASTTSWVTGGVSLDSSTSSSVSLIGNGGIDGDVYCTGSSSITVNAGNSPGTFFITGSLTLSPSTTLIVDIASNSDWDKYVIHSTFHRAGTLYINFDGSFVPSSNKDFEFASHTSASGSFANTRGNNAENFDRVQTNGTDESSYFYLTGASSGAPTLSLAAALVFIFSAMFVF